MRKVCFVMRKIWVKYVCVFACVLLSLMFLLWVSTKLPQAKIDQNIAKSYARLASEGPYAYVLDGRPTSMLDNYTDSIILTVCKSSGPQEDKAFLTNPFFGGSDVLGALGKYCAGEQEPDSYYVRYWLGFRMFFRPLLEFLDLQQIRYVTIAVFFCLFSMAVLSVSRNVSVRAGIAFLLSIYLIRPYICSRCMQYVCCPVISLSAVLFVPWVERKIENCPLFFMVIGMVTMFFDFYTVPVLTFGLPMIYLMAIRGKKGSQISLKTVLFCFAGWSAGYVMTWIVKLALVELFTEYKGFSNGFSELQMWLRRSPESASVAGAFKQAFIALWGVILPDIKTRIIISALCAAVIVALAYEIKKGNWPELKENSTVLAVGLLPLLWFAAATKPITNHAFFQYRSIAVSYWAIGAWVSGTFRKRSPSDFD